MGGWKYQGASRGRGAPLLGIASSLPGRSHAVKLRELGSRSIPLLPRPLAWAGKWKNLGWRWQCIGSNQWKDSGCEQEVAEAAKGDSEEEKAGSIMRLSWALVHSRQPDDVHRGIAMLEASLANKRSSSPLQEREKLYLLAVGNYRSGEYSKSRKLLEKCLEISPDWRQALALKNMVEEQITKDGVIGIGITATTVGLIVGGLAAALARR